MLHVVQMPIISVELVVCSSSVFLGVSTFCAIVVSLSAALAVEPHDEICILGFLNQQHVTILLSGALLRLAAASLSWMQGAGFRNRDILPARVEVDNWDISVGDSLVSCFANPYMHV